MSAVTRLEGRHLQWTPQIKDENALKETGLLEGREVEKEPEPKRWFSWIIDLFKSIGAFFGRCFGALANFFGPDLTGVREGIDKNKKMQDNAKERMDIIWMTFISRTQEFRAQCQVLSGFAFCNGGGSIQNLLDKLKKENPEDPLIAECEERHKCESSFKSDYQIEDFEALVSEFKVVQAESQLLERFVESKGFTFDKLWNDLDPDDELLRNFQLLPEIAAE